MQVTRGVQSRRRQRQPGPGTGPLAEFLFEVMRRRRVLPSQLAADLGVSHATVSRWLSGKDIPGIASCQRLADYSGESLSQVLSVVGHIPGQRQNVPFEWPSFREYARQKYADVLDEDLISMIEDLIERRRQRHVPTALTGGTRHNGL